MSYDPTTDPRWTGDYEMRDTEAEVRRMSEEVADLAAMRETFRTPGWVLLANRLIDANNAAARELVAYARDRTPADYAYAQGQIAKASAVVDLPRHIDSRYEELLAELDAIQNPALA